MAKHHSPRFLALVEDAKKRVREMSVAQLKERLGTGGFHLVDVREGEEWAAGHIPGAQHLCKGIIERDVETHIPNKDEAVLLYCGGGYRSVLAADALQQMGYTNVVSMDGGIKAWRDAGYAMER